MAYKNKKARQQETLLAEYKVCEQDNAGNSQTYWALSAIFIGISSALLAGMIYGVISNDTLLSALVHKNEPRKTLLVGIIAIVLGTAMLIILKKLKGWVRRIQFNQRINKERMMEIELELGMKREWRGLAIDKWCENPNKEKEEARCKQERWSILEKLLKDEINPKYYKQLDKIKEDLLWSISKNSLYYETRSSKKHYPCIIHILMFLWVLVIAMAAFIMLEVNKHFNWGLGLMGIIIVVWLIMVFWNNLCRCIKNFYKKYIGVIS